MSLFPLFKKKEFFSATEKDMIVDAVKVAEKETSGEVRVYIESHCKFVNPLDRAAELFFGLKMDQTSARNAVLVYVALKDRQLAIYGDVAIHEKVGETFWQEQVLKMIQHFNRENYASGIANVIMEIGDALKTHFPYDSATDKNELPDDIVFGK